MAASSFARRVHSAHPLLLMALPFALAFSACVAGTVEPEPDADACPDGTRLEGGDCVADIACGEGTILVAGECVPERIPNDDPGADDAGPCTPQCDGRVCGDDACGGSCGACDDGALCNAITGQCDDDVCIPVCSNKECGDDGCGGTCGTCGSGTSCDQGLCVAPPASSSCVGNCGAVATDGCSCEPGCELDGTCCVDRDFVCGCLPNCIDKNCGSDGCGGTCGACLDEDLCSAQQVCVDNPCLPNPCTEHGTCDELTGACACADGYTGTACDACAEGFAGFPTCVVDQCALVNETCFGHGTCVAPGGSCDCDPGFAGPQCGSCAAGAGTYPDCMAP